MYLRVQYILSTAHNTDHPPIIITFGKKHGVPTPSINLSPETSPWTKELSASKSCSQSSLHPQQNSSRSQYKCHCLTHVPYPNSATPSRKKWISSSSPKKTYNYHPVPFGVQACYTTQHSEIVVLEEAHLIPSSPAHQCHECKLCCIVYSG
jgi:hypothetical protein